MPRIPACHRLSRSAESRTPAIPTPWARTTVILHSGSGRGGQGTRITRTPCVHTTTILHPAIRPAGQKNFKFQALISKQYLISKFLKLKNIIYLKEIFYKV